jgi:hypothetical protein
MPIVGNETEDIISPLTKQAGNALTSDRCLRAVDIWRLSALRRQQASDTNAKGLKFAGE